MLPQFWDSTSLIDRSIRTRQRSRRDASRLLDRPQVGDDRSRIASAEPEFRHTRVPAKQTRLELSFERLERHAPGNTPKRRSVGFRTQSITSNRMADCTIPRHQRLATPPKRC